MCDEEEAVAKARRHAPQKCARIASQSMGRPHRTRQMYNKLITLSAIIPLLWCQLSPLSHSFFGSLARSPLVGSVFAPTIAVRLRCFSFFLFQMRWYCLTFYTHIYAYIATSSSFSSLLRFHLYFLRFLAPRKRWPKRMLACIQWSNHVTNLFSCVVVVVVVCFFVETIFGFNLENDVDSSPMNNPTIRYFLWKYST